MGRSGYTNDCENLGLWRGAVQRAIAGYRGQAFLRKLLAALDALPVKRLIADEPKNAAGEVCALGSIDPSFGGVDYHDAREVADHFGVAWALAAEIEYQNDEADRFGWLKAHDGTTWVQCFETPEQRWTRMRAWVSEQIRADV